MMRLRPCSIALALAAIALSGCTCGGAPATSEPGTTSDAEPVTRVADLPPAPPLRRGVEHFWVTELVPPGRPDGRREEGDESRDGRVAILRRGPAPGGRPVDAEPLGALLEHEGTYELHRLSEVPSPYSTLTLVGRGEICDVRVERAVDAWLRVAAPAAEREGGDPGAVEPVADEPVDELDELAQLDAEEVQGRVEPDERVLLLMLADGCGGVAASAAIGGGTVTRRGLEHAELTPASAELVARVNRFETGTGAVPTRGPIRAVALGEPGAFVVAVPDLVYVVRGGAVTAVLDGLPFAELTAGSRVFLHCTSSQGDYLAPLDAMQAAPG